MNSTQPGPQRSPAALPSDRTRCPLIVTVTDTCRAAISLNAAAAADGKETGGILLGHHHNYSQPVLDVVHAGDAGPRAVRQAAFFQRDVTHAQALADVAYSTDGSVWLGEWHTHPGRLSKPSFLDLASYRQMPDDPELEFTFFLAVIVLSGQADGWDRPCLTGWVVSTANVWSVHLQPQTHPQGAS